MCDYSLHQSRRAARGGGDTAGSQCSSGAARNEMAEYRRPFLEAGDDRWPTLQWAREVPLSGEPADVHDRIAAYSAWLKTTPPPKLFVDAEPGVFVTGRIRRLARVPKGYRPRGAADAHSLARMTFLSRG
jgi:hypothetical protein